VQIPGLIGFAVEAETVQMAGVIEAKLTGRLELAVAVNETATDVLGAWAGIVLKVITCVNGLTAKLRAAEAGAKTTLPPWLA
jgi:hypothetical protein